MTFLSKAEYRRQRQWCVCGHQRMFHTTPCCGCKKLELTKRRGRPKVIHNAAPMNVKDTQEWVRNQRKRLWDNSVDVFIACMEISSTLDPRKWENV